MNRLVQIDRGGVADDGLPGSRTDQRAEAVAEPERQVEPSGRVPAPDQILPPFLFDGAAEDCSCRARHRPQRIAVKVDHAVRDDEAGAKRSEGIGCVARHAGFARNKVSGGDHFRPSEIAGGRDPAGASSSIKPRRGLATLLAAGQRISRLTAKTHSFTFQIIRNPPTCSFSSKLRTRVSVAYGRKSRRPAWPRLP